MNFKRISIKNKQKKKKHSKVLHSLFSLLEWINSVPVDVVLPDYREVLRQIIGDKFEIANQPADSKAIQILKNEWTEEFIEQCEMRTFEQLSSELKTVSPEFYELLMTAFSVDVFDVAEFFDVYNEIRETRDYVRALALESTFCAKHEINLPALLSKAPKNAFTVSFAIHDGKLIFPPEIGLVYLLDGLEYQRLRLCEVCDRVFWAQRLDKWSCSKKCNIVRRVRKKRRADKEKEEKLNTHFQSRKKK